MVEIRLGGGTSGPSRCGPIALQNYSTLSPAFLPSSLVNTALRRILMADPPKQTTVLLVQHSSPGFGIGICAWLQT